MTSETSFGNCLMPLLKALHWSGSLRNLKESLPYFTKIETASAFRTALENLQFKAKTLQIDPRDLDERLLPALMVSKNKEPSVLLAREKKQYRIFDGDLNQERLVDAEELAFRYPDSTIYIFKEKMFEKTVSARGWFWSTVRKNQGLILSALFLSFILSLLMLSTPLFVMAVYDSVITTSSYSMLGQFGGGIIIALIGIYVLYRMRAEHLALIGARFSRVIGDRIMSQLLYLAPIYTETATPGAQVARIKDFDRVREFISGPSLSIFFELPFILIALIIIAVLGGMLVFIPLAMIVVFILIALTLSTKINKWIKKSSKNYAELQEFLLESIESVRVLKYTASTQRWSQRYREKSATSNLISIKLTVYDGISSTLSEIVMISSGMLVLAFGAILAMEGTLPIGAMLAIMIIVWRILAPIKSLVSILPRVLQLTSSIKQIDRLMALQTENLQIARVKQEKINFRGDIIFARVSMRYPSAYNPSLLGVNFSIKAGSFVAITGRNGSGKSTVLKVLLGLYQPQAGAILIDDRDIRQVNSIDLRASIGYLPQNPELFYGTIADNLRLGDPSASDEALNLAAKNAGILDTILNLPKGFETRIHDQSEQILSKSFTQSLCLARAYLRDSSILLLDEPGNTLDREADSQLINYLTSLRGKKTIAMVTHRPSHWNKADNILLMDQGQLILQGPPGDVLQKIPQGLL